MPASRGTRTARLRALVRLSRLASSSHDLGVVLAGIARSASGLMRVPVVSVWTVDEATRTLAVKAFSKEAHAKDFPLTSLDSGQDGVGWVAQHRKPLSVPDVFSHGRFRALDWWKRHRLRSFYAVPVVLDGVLLAVLAFHAGRPFRFSAEDRDMLDSLVAQAAGALAHARRLDAAERGRRQADAMVEAAHGVNDSLELGMVLQRVAERARELCRSERAVIAFREAGRKGARLRRWAGARHPKDGPEWLDPGAGSGGWVLRNGRPFRADGRARDPRIHADGLDRVRDEGRVAEIVVPIRVGARVEGLLAVQNRVGRPFSAADETLLLQLADHAAVAIQNAQLFAGERVARREAEAAERRYRLLYQRNMTGMFRCTRDGRVLECNESIARMLGYASREEALAAGAQVFWVDPADRDRLLARIDQDRPFSNEVRLRRKDGSEMWALVNVTPVSEGGTKWLEGILLDITDRKRMEAAQRARESLRSVSSLASAAAHEIYNPLTVVMGSLDLVGRRVDDATVREWVDRGREAVRRIRDIIERMSRISRLQVAQGSPSLPPMLDIRRSSAEPRDAPEGR